MLAPQNTPSPPRQKRRRYTRATVAFFILFCMSAALCVFFYIKYQSTQSQTDAPQRTAETALSILSEHVELPQEEPTVVTIADKQKLSNKVLAARVENDDILLIFPEAKRLAVYRPSTQKLVDMLTFNETVQIDQ